MQQPTLQIRDRLLAGLDKDYNVVNMEIVVDVLSQLENFAITREALEATRLGKHINELRRKAQDRYLASRAKNLVKKWRQLLVTSATGPLEPSQQGVPNHANGGEHNRSNNHSPALIPSGASTTTTSNKKAVAATSAQTNNNHSSLPSSASTSPGLSRPTTPATSRPVSPYNDTAGVSRTNAANKRLRKAADPADEVDEPSAKRAAYSNGFGNNGTSSEFLLDGDTRDSVQSVASNTCDSFNSKVRPPSAASTYPEGNNQSQTDAMNAFSATTQALPATLSKPRTRSMRKSMEKQPDVLEQQMLSVRKAAGKVRTTQEIVQELALRAHSPGLVSRAAAAANAAASVVGAAGDGIAVKETKQELMHRFFESQSNFAPGSAASSNGLSPPLSRAPSPTSTSDPNSPDDGTTSVEASRSATPLVTARQKAAAAVASGGAETVEEVMARLPLIRASEILASMEEASLEDDDDDGAGEDIEGLIPVKKPELEVTDELVVKLHESHMETFNGNFNHRGEFCEWHEVLTKETKDGDILYVLPYSVID